MTYEMWWGTPLLAYYHGTDLSYSETGVSLEYSVDVPYTLFFVTHSNTESMFL
jgi:hypothetical protein